MSNTDAGMVAMELEQMQYKLNEMARKVDVIYEFVVLAQKQMIAIAQNPMAAAYMRTLGVEV